MEDLYARLMERMDEFPLGAPESERLLELLRMIFDREQAALALELPGYPVEAGEFADRLGRDLSEVEAALERMADDGLVFAREKRGKKYYSLLPLLPGIFETQFMKAEATPEKRRLAELFDAYYHEGWGEKSFSGAVPMARVLPVEEEVSRKDRVLPYERVSAYIKSSASKALTTCFCRHQAELLGRACGAPKDVCMALGPFADFLVERGFARRATTEEMLEALDRAEEAGLVHLTDNFQDKVNFICNCCGCCCGFLGTLTKLGLSGSVAAASYAASVDPDLCSGCEDCLAACQVSAIAMRGGTASVDPARCIGCGLCASRCPSSAITVSEREGWAEPRGTLAELGAALLQERGRL